MKLIGIDVGRANTGIVIYDADLKKVIENITIEIPIAKARREFFFNPSSGRLLFIYNEVGRILKKVLTIEDLKIGQSLAIVEDYAYGKNKISIEEFRKMDKMSLEVGEAHGAVYIALRELNIPMIKVSPTQLKCFITGDGTSGKSEVIRFGSIIYHEMLDDDHQYDALALCHIGRYYIVYCKNQKSIEEGSYEYNAIVGIAYQPRFANVSKIFGLNL